MLLATSKLLIRLDFLKPIIKAIHAHHGTAYLVGGCVRDAVLDLPIKDIDVEIHNLSLETIEQLLGSFGVINLVGKQFGVFRLYGIDVDWSTPRKDSSGRKPSVNIDSSMDFTQAARRRDITMNAMGINLNELLLESHETIAIIDPYQGLQAIKEKRISAVDKELFLEDPLRFFRVMQFISRFEMTPDQELTKLCSSMNLNDSESGKTIARERIEEEIKKLFLKSRRPSLGFRWLKEINRLQELFPELHALIGIQQISLYHPEGDAFEHTMQAIDAAAQLSYVDDKEKLWISIATLCHDLGKAVTTDDQFHAYNHEKESVPLTQTLLARFTRDQELIDAVKKLVYFHMRPIGLVKGKAKNPAYKRLAADLGPTLSLHQLALLAIADCRGRNGNSQEPLIDDIPEISLFLEKAKYAKVAFQAEPPILQGRDLLSEVEPGPRLGKLLKKAYEIQIEEEIHDKEELKKRVL